MKHTGLWKKLLCLVLVVLLAAAALTLTGCKKKQYDPASAGDAEATPASGGNAETEPASDEDVTDAAPIDDGSASDVIERGEGQTLFYFDVTFSDGSTKSYAIHTDADTVGEALLSEGLISGEDSQYGLYVTGVDGETLSWDSDGMYWAFYIDGEYAMSGVDSTDVEAGSTYAFVATEG